MIIIKIVILGDTAYDYGWHEFTLSPGTEAKLSASARGISNCGGRTHRGNWKISLLINNADVREQMAGQTSHWFLSEKLPASRFLKSPTCSSACRTGAR